MHRHARCSSIYSLIKSTFSEFSAVIDTFRPGNQAGVSVAACINGSMNHCLSRRSLINLKMADLEKLTLRLPLSLLS